MAKIDASGPSAAARARTEPLRRPAGALEAAEADLEVRDGRATVRGLAGRGISAAELVAYPLWTGSLVQGHGAFLAEPTPLQPAPLTGRIFPAFDVPSSQCYEEGGAPRIDLGAGAGPSPAHAD